MASRLALQALPAPAVAASRGSGAAPVHAAAAPGGRSHQPAAACRAAAGLQPPALAPAPPQPPMPRRSALLAATAAALLGPAAGALTPAPAAAVSPDTSSWSSPGLASRPEDAVGPAFEAKPSGVRFQEVVVGRGPQAAPGSVVEFDYVLRRSNGYFVYATVEGVGFQPPDVPTAPVIITLGKGALIPGFEEVLAGMRPGGKRRALVPPAVGYLAMPNGEPRPPTWAARRQVSTHAAEPFLFEVVVRRVRG